MKNLVLLFLLLFLSLTNIAFGQMPERYSVALYGEVSTIPLIAIRHGDTYSTSGKTPPEGVQYRIDVYTDGKSFSSISVVMFSKKDGSIMANSIIGNIQYAISLDKDGNYTLKKISQQVTKKDATEKEKTLVKEFSRFQGAIIKIAK